MKNITDCLTVIVEHIKLAKLENKDTCVLHLDSIGKRMPFVYLFFKLTGIEYKYHGGIHDAVEITNINSLKISKLQEYL